MNRANTATVVSMLKDLQQEFSDTAERYEKSNPVSAFLHDHRFHAKQLRYQAERVGKTLAECQSIPMGSE